MYIVFNTISAFLIYHVIIVFLKLSTTVLGLHKYLVIINLFNKSYDAQGATSHEISALLTKQTIVFLIRLQNLVIMQGFGYFDFVSEYHYIFLLALNLLQVK